MVNKIVLSERDREYTEPVGQNQLDSLEVLKRKYFDTKKKKKGKRYMV